LSDLIFGRDTQHNQGATLIDLGVTWSPAKDVDVYGTIQSLTNYRDLQTAESSP
jgi:hypothetical protein